MSNLRERSISNFTEQRKQAIFQFHHVIKTIAYDGIVKLYCEKCSVSTQYRIVDGGGVYFFVEMSTQQKLNKLCKRFDIFT